MAPKRIPASAKGKGTASSSAAPEQAAGGRRTKDQIARDERERWEASIEQMGVKNERHVIRDGFLENDETIRAIVRQGMSFWFNPNPGYNLELVREFYKHFQIPASGTAFSSETQITSRVGKTPIIITPDVIAASLRYHRPTDVNYPCPAEDFTPHTVTGLLYERRADAGNPHRPGKFRPAYRFVNQVVCYNLDPRATENKPSETTGNMLTAFMDPDTVCDWALFIYSKIIDFRDAPTQTRMPFPCLITAIARDSGLSGAKWFNNDPLVPGAIDITILTKSRAQTRGARGGTYLTTQPPPSTANTTWLQKIFCQGVATIRSHQKLKREVRQNARMLQQMNHREEWMVRRLEGSTSDPYVPLEFPELEVSDDFADGEPEPEEVESD